MAHHNITGKNGEALALAYLIRNDFVILHTNWRHSHYEIDIIAYTGNILHFIEVKTRRSLRFGYPEESVTKKKMESLMNGAEVFLLLYPQWKRIQYDILSVNLRKNQDPEYFFIEDVSL
ncbi:YraN family protein [Agriterribacter humi]|jgi:putative endonuclease|uniref:YraN family protein n=1 Tax=Agriterribacter humi TaxID=1104781 RepID=UPI001264264F|nr:YraN family protein [Agriterribacter humi]